MNPARPRLAAFAFACAFGLLPLVSGCSDHWVEADYVVPAEARGTATATDELSITEGSAAAVVLVSYRQSRFPTIDRVATGATMDDEAIATVHEAAGGATVDDSSGSEESGQVFVLYGHALGDTVLHVLVDGEDQGAVTIHVVPQVL